jgi:vancomycin permeability regulator SanA
MISKIIKLLVCIYILVTAPFVFFTGLAALALQQNARLDQTALVLGAGIKCELKTNIPLCLPSNVLKNRLDKALELYATGKIKKILVSGNGNQPYYNETRVMVNYLQANKVSVNNIIADYRGNSTYDSCKNAKQEFNLKKVLIITQAFHMSRSVYFCKSFGLDVGGQIADDSSQETTKYGLARELPASWKALGLVHCPQCRLVALEVF